MKALWFSAERPARARLYGVGGAWFVTLDTPAGVPWLDRVITRFACLRHALPDKGTRWIIRKGGPWDTLWQILAKDHGVKELDEHEAEMMRIFG
jgi:hypothetical protein